MYTILITAPPYSLSNIGRISLKAGLKVGVPQLSEVQPVLVHRSPLMIASPAIAAITTINARMSTLTLRKSAGCADYALLHSAWRTPCNRGKPCYRPDFTISRNL